jgi:hypothetical protein
MNFREYPFKTPEAFPEGLVFVARITMTSTGQRAPRHPRGGNGDEIQQQKCGGYNRQFCSGRWRGQRVARVGKATGLCGSGN